MRARLGVSSLPILARIRRIKFGSCAWVPLGDPAKDMIEISVGLLADDDLHNPKRRNLSSNSARVNVFGFVSARRRRNSASCSSLKR
jgi:hypothetical protein